MSNHLLLTHAIRRPYSETPSMPVGAVYDHRRGYWMCDDTPYIRHPDFHAQMTKKCDIETGEDLKGE